MMCRNTYNVEEQSLKFGFHLPVVTVAVVLKASSFHSLCAFNENKFFLVYVFSLHELKLKKKNSINHIVVFILLARL